MSALPLWAYPLLFLGALALSALLTPVALGFATRHGILDHPAPGKSHAKAVPYLGGAAIVVAFAAALVVGALVDPPSAGLGQLAALLGLALVLAVVGLADDVRGLPIWMRLGVELGAGVGVWATGTVMHLAGFPGWADALVTIAWVVVVTNALNLLDNMDGLSAGVASIGALGLFGIAVVRGEFLVAALAIALAGCAAGFLRHNFHPARIYMGDAGSLFLGFLLSVLALKLRDNPATRVDVAALVAVLGVALFDTTLVVVSRLAHRRSPFTGGQDHTSHRLVHLGLPVRAAVGVVYAAAAALAGIGVALGQAGSAVHIAGIVVLGVAGIVTLAMLALVPVYGDTLDERMSAGLVGRVERGGREWVTSAGRRNASAHELPAGSDNHEGPDSDESDDTATGADTQLHAAWTGSGVFISLPVLNERDNIDELLDRIAATMADNRYLVCVVDDSSTDGTGDILQRRQSEDPNHLYVITRPRSHVGSKRGGALVDAIKWGLANTSFDTFVEMDGDLSHRPEEIPRLLAPLRTNVADVVIASKYLDSSRVLNRPLARQLVSITGNTVARCLLTPTIRDYSNGYRAYNRSAAQAASTGKHHCTSPIYLSEVLAYWMRISMRVVEVPTEYVGRNEGISKLRWSDLAKGLVAITGIAIQHHVSRLIAPAGLAVQGQPALVDSTRALPGTSEVFNQAPGDFHRVRTGVFATALLLAAVAAIAVIAGAVADLWFVERTPVFDELGLFNPIYMFVHTGSMTYPIYPFPGTRYAMFVHPPTHYFIVALLMLTTHLSAEAAAVLPVLFWIGLSALILWLGRFSVAWKFGGLAGLFAGMVLLSPSLFIRPEPDLAGAWITGLLALEAGRRRDWDFRLLGFGSFCLALASAMQYFALASWLGVVPYVLWLLRDRGRSGTARPLAAMAVGGAFVGLPWLSFFVIPDFHSILLISRATNGSFNPFAAIADNMRAMRDYYGLKASGPFLHVALVPLAVTGLPALVATTPFLIWRRDTRGIALASLPFMAFLFLVDRIPHAEGVGYLTPEVTLYLMCVYALGLLAITRLLALLRARDQLRRILGAVAGCLLVLSVVTTGTSSILATGRAYRSPHPLHDEMGLARAAGYSILGAGAKLASPNVSLFYISGGSSWYAAVPDPLQGLTAGVRHRLNVRAYLHAFTALPIGSDGSDAARWYEDGLLRPRGFYISAGAPEVSYVLLSSHISPSRPLEGYVSDHGYLTRYVQTRSSRIRFVTAICPNPNAGMRNGIPGATASLLTPVAPHADGKVVFAPADGGSLLLSLLAPASNLSHLFRTGVLRTCRLHSEFPVTGSHVSARSLMAWARLHGSGRTIRFPEYPAALDALFSPMVPTHVVDTLQVMPSEISAGSTTTRVASGSLLRTSALRWSQALEAPIPPAGSGVDRWVELRGVVRAGVPGMCILDVTTHTCLDRRQLTSAMTGIHYLPIPATRDPIALYIDNEGSSGAASLVIRQISIVAARSQGRVP